ncbi:MAG: hypothetical protein K9N49_00660 [Candidatus Marinimicrobia bacterium]|nr:hypothetical protein [Candidatus Neomarinimicrobiota bacterium]
MTGKRIRIVIGVVFILAAVLIFAAMAFEGPSEVMILAGLGSLSAGILTAGGKKGLRIIKKILNVLVDMGSGNPRTRMNH